MLRKSQISVFIILGILIIAIFGFMFFITSEVGKIKLETQANKILDSVLATTPIDYYVTLCLEEGTKRALNASGMHGGLIDFSDATQKTEFNRMNISYYVDYGIFNSQPDVYPCNSQMGNNWNSFPRFCGFLNNASFPYWNETKLGQTDVNSVGYIISPMLLESCGTANRACAELEEDFNISFQGLLIPQINPRFAKSETEPTIEKQIEEYIANYTYECSEGILNVSSSNLSAFSKFEINVSNITVDVVFGFNGVEVSADYPIEIKIQNVEPIIRILKFSYFSPVRYKYVYLLARWIAEQEIRELDFDILRDWRRFVPHQKYGLDFQVAVERTAADTVVMISDMDDDHYLRNGPFQFLFAIKNRPPVLDFIPEYDNPAAYQNVFLIDHDIYVVEKETITIRPKAYDPDGDELNYSYSGWKETEDAYFNENTPGVDCRDEAQVKNCVNVIPNVAPRNWTTSQTYLDQYPSASYKTNHSDIGYHVVTVCAYEKNNPSMKDCQNVTILVDDVFEVIASAINCYDDITNDTLISIEDPVCLDANVIDYFNPGYTSYLWKTSTETIYEGEQKLVMLPRDYILHLHRYIPGLIDYFSSTDSQLFSLLVTRGTAVKSTDLTLEAKNCIPHRQNDPTTKMGDNPPASYPSYPFHNLSYSGQNPEGYYSYPDPFLGNHTCCNDNWNYQSAGTECFRYAEYGWYNSEFLDIASQANVNIANFLATYSKTNEGINNNKPTNLNLTNDIIKREFLSYCSGSSGNKCSSDVTAKFTNITSCLDWKQTTAENAVVESQKRCQGANITAQWFNPEDPNPQCILFWPNMTFEKYAGLETDEDAGICGELLKCGSDNSSNTGFMKGTDTIDKFYLCQATCFNGSCQKPVNCLNCRDEEGACEKTPWVEGTDLNKNYKIKQNISFVSGYCYASVLPSSSDSCDSTARAEKEDVCQDSRHLIEYDCWSDYGGHPEINYSSQFDCATISEFESEARTTNIEIQPDASLYKIQCIPGNRSQCADGACFVNTTEMRSDNIKVEDCPGNMFRGVDFEDTDDTSTKESCKYKNPVDPDTDRRACVAVCGFSWIDIGTPFCCGDDLGEVIGSPTCQ